MAEQQARSDGRKAGQAPRLAEGKTGSSRNKETVMKVRLIDREPVHVAYLRYTGSLRPGDREVLDADRRAVDGD